MKSTLNINCKNMSSIFFKKYEGKQLTAELWQSLRSDIRTYDFNVPKKIWECTVMREYMILLSSIEKRTAFLTVEQRRGYKTIIVNY